MGQPTNKLVIDGSTVQSAKTLSPDQAYYISALLLMGVDIADVFNLPKTWTGYNAPYKGVGSSPSGISYSTTYPANVIDQVKAKYTDYNLGFDSTLINAMRASGISVDVTTGTSGVNVKLDPLKNTSEIAKQTKAAVSSGVGIQTAFDQVLDGMDMSNLNEKVRDFFADPSNNPAIQQAVNVLGYSVPSTTDVTGILNMRQLYWAAYYSKYFPIPELDATNCGQIDETLNQLKQEKANIDEGNIEQMYSTYNRDDWKLRAQAVTDITTRFNGMYGQLNCTKVNVQSSSDNATSSKFLKYTLIGFVALVLVVIIVKSTKKRS